MICWKMVRPPHSAALCAVLFFAAPAAAQTLGPPEREQARPSKPDFRVRISSHTAPEDPATPHATPEGSLFSGVKPGLGVSHQTFREQDGSAAVASGLVRSWSVSPGMNAGLGLFTVTHEDQKEAEFRRNWSAKNVGPRNRRVAAVGLNVRF